MVATRNDIASGVLPAFAPLFSGGGNVYALVHALSRVTTSPIRRHCLSFKPQGHAERQTTAADAKRAQMEQFRAKFGANDPNFAARQAERIKIAEARTQREAERSAIKEKEAAEAAVRKAAEDAARKIAEEEARVAAEIFAREEADRAVLAEAEAKAARDARYAARKARGIKRGKK
jgi:hypothetical protein